jgi:hypothetical protein
MEESLQGKTSGRKALPEVTILGNEVVRPAKNQVSAARKGATKALKYDIARSWATTGSQNDQGRLACPRKIHLEIGRTSQDLHTRHNLLPDGSGILFHCLAANGVVDVEGWFFLWNPSFTITKIHDTLSLGTA